MKVGIIGCGAIARKAHIPAYRSSGVDIIAVADTNERRARSCARKFKVKNWYTDYTALLNEDPDLVSICTPPSTHREIAVNAAKAGASVLVEKPMTTSLEDADRMLDTCRNSGVKLCVVQNYRFFPCVLEAKKRLEDGRIGDIVSLHAIEHDFLDEMDTSWRYEKWGILEDLGPHVIDIINFLFNSSLDDVKVVARDYTGTLNCLSHVQALLLLKNKACADIDLSWMTGAYEFSVQILGTAGTIQIDVRNNSLREIHGYTTPLEDLRATIGKSATIGRAVLNRSYFRGALHYHAAIIAKFLESINNGTDPPVTGEEGRAVVSVIDSIKKAITTSRSSD